MSPRPPASGPPESPPASRHPAHSTSRWCSTRDPTTPPRACSPATRSRRRRCCGRSRCSPPGGCARSILNSGGANACTGPLGFQDTHATAEAVAAALSDWGTETGAIEVAVCSTGLIGDRLPMDKVLAGVTEIVHEMAGGLTGGEEAARAIMTTDTVPKQVALHHSDNWTVGGMAKGAGMLAPSLATMLCVITTDAVADAAALDQALREGGRADIRPARRRRQLLDQRHRAAAGLRCQRDRAEPRRSRRRGAAGLRRPVRTTAGRRRGRHQAHRRHRDRRRSPSRTR